MKTSLSNYTSGLLYFTKFCDDPSIAETEKMPTSEDLLTIIIATRGAGSVAKELSQNGLRV